MEKNIFTQKISEDLYYLYNGYGNLKNSWYKQPSISYRGGVSVNFYACHIR